MQLTVVLLKAKLVTLGLDTSGRKPVLVARVKEAESAVVLAAANIAGPSSADGSQAHNGAAGTAPAQMLGLIYSCGLAGGITLEPGLFHCCKLSVSSALRGTKGMKIRC